MRSPPPTGLRLFWKTSSGTSRKPWASNSASPPSADS